MIGNTILVQHGIEHERSDLRAHVGVLANMVYVFSTKNALQTLETGKYSTRPAFTNVPGLGKVQTALGYIVPIGDLEPREIYVADIIAAVEFAERNTTSQKGAKAQTVIYEMLRAGRFPLPVTPAIVTDASIQKQGFDLVVKGRWYIEIKCDYRAGVYRPQFHAPELAYKLTGNLYLQTHESNPLRQH